MNLILIISVLAVVDCSPALPDLIPSPQAVNTTKTSNCTRTYKLEIYNAKKECLENYIKHSLYQKNIVISTPTVPTTSATTPAGINMSISSTPPITNTTTIAKTIMATTNRNESTSKEICSNLNNVKNFFENSWGDYQSQTTKNNHTLSGDILKEYQIGNDIRFELLDIVFKETKLEEIKKEDVDCIKNLKNLTNECLVKNIKSMDVKKVHVRISHTLSRTRKYNLQKTTCETSEKLNLCIKNVLKVCSKALLIIGNIEEVISKRCKIILNPPPIIPKNKGLSAIMTVLIAFACIIFIAAAIYGALKYTKIRRSGHHTITRNPEECEMTTRSRPSTKNENVASNSKRIL